MSRYYSDDIILSHCFSEKYGNAEGCLCAYCVSLTPVENYSDKEDMFLHTKGSAPQKISLSLSLRYYYSSYKINIKARQSVYVYVTLRCVRASIVAVEKQ
jgi:hypothetical protein